MADSNIGALPLAPNIEDDSLLVMEQQGSAMKLTGAMLKEYAKQGVELEFQDYLDEAQEAADNAAEAVSAVTDMTVSAHANDTPTVTKSMQNGKVNLDFGLPRGDRGLQGEQGPVGPQGPPGNGLTILGHYNTEAELRSAVPNPSVGDPYSVGTTRPYDIYIFDGPTNDWMNYGPLLGEGGILPDNLVTCEGGATIILEGDFGEAPHTIPIKSQPPTAADVEYQDGETVEGALDKLFTSVSDGKSLIASAITDKGVPTAQDAEFAQMAENIKQIATGSDTSDATATPGDILGGKTAYTASGKVEGIIPSLPAQVIIPGTAAKTIANGQYLSGTQTIQGDSNLVSSNIRKGVSIFGVPGAVESLFAATLTVTADIGAVVTATCGDTTVEALSTTGTVVMELPIEGTWEITAVRGMAQYNTVTLEVSNQYSAELTAALHIQWLMTATPLSVARSELAAASVGNYAIFYGGTANCGIDTYGKDLIHGDSSDLFRRSSPAAASTDDYAIFAGGCPGNFADIQNNFTSSVTSYGKTLTKTEVLPPLSVARYDFAAAAVGNYAVFGGGYGYDKASRSAKAVADVDAYNNELTHSSLTPLAAPIKEHAAAANENYAVFAGAGSMTSAYNKNLTRSIVAGLSESKVNLAAARAGGYILFAGGASGDARYNSVDAYDLFLTRTTPEALNKKRSRLSATTLNSFAIFGSGRGVSSSSGVNEVDVYDPYLVRTTPTPFGGWYDYAVASVGSYALFGGGSGPNNTNAVNVYKYT